MSAKPLVIDTSTWVDWSRGRSTSSRQLLHGRVIFMPAVVAMELLAGARDRRTLNAVNKLLDPFIRHRRIIVPTFDDYTRAGSIIAELGWAASKHSNDVLIAAVARRLGAELMTLNHRHFAPVCQRLGLLMR